MWVRSPPACFGPFLVGGPPAPETLELCIRAGFYPISRDPSVASIEKKTFLFCLRLRSPLRLFIFSWDRGLERLFLFRCFPLASRGVAVCALPSALGSPLLRGVRGRRRVPGLSFQPSRGSRPPGVCGFAERWRERGRLMAPQEEPAPCSCSGRR